MTGLPAAGQHLLGVAKLTFEVIEDPDEAVETAAALVGLMLGHVPAGQRLQAGAALVGRALQPVPPVSPSSAPTTPRRGGDG